MWDLPKKVATHNRFLILGPKGTGKSAAARYIELAWKEKLGEASVFPIRLDFDELNRTQTSLTDLDTKNVSPDLNTPSADAWRLFVGVRLFESLITDPSCTLYNDTQARTMLKELKEAGLASDDYPAVLRSVRTRKGGFTWRGLNLSKETSETETMSVGQIGDALLSAVLNARSGNRHLMTIDGLDKGISANDSYWRTLASLIRVGADFTARALERNSSHVFLLIMCRSDVFRKIAFSDAAKVAEDWGIHISWHTEAANPRDVLLWDYLASKAAISKKDLLSYLPDHVKVGQGGVKADKFLLDVTRYTPRDMSALFRRLQEETHGASGPTPDESRVAGERFAREFLLNEIKSEAVGLLSQTVVSRMESLLAGLRQRLVTTGELLSTIRDLGIYGEVTPNEIGEYLFLQGAFSNYDPSTGYIQSYHRRDTTDFKANGPWVLHTGLLYALNIPWSRI